MVSVPDLRLEEPGFESRCPQVGGSILIQVISFIICRLPLPIRTGQRGRVGQQHQHAKHYRAMAAVLNGTERVHDQGGGFGQLGIRAGGAKNPWVKTSHRKRVRRLNIATYNV